MKKLLGIALACIMGLSLSCNCLEMSYADIINESVSETNTDIKTISDLATLFPNACIDVENYYESLSVDIDPDNIFVIEEYTSLENGVIYTLYKYNNGAFGLCYDSNDCRGNQLHSYLYYGMDIHLVTLMVYYNENASGYKQITNAYGGGSQVILYDSGVNSADNIGWTKVNAYYDPGDGSDYEYLGIYFSVTYNSDGSVSKDHSFSEPFS